MLALYGFAASVLPVWMLLTPRDYLSTFMKIGTILFLILGVVIVHPTLQAPAVSQFAGGGGPIIPGPLFPFVFITIACGAISGFHSLIATGTTPKMLDRESDMRPIGYGAMLCEGVVALMAMTAATALHPGDYYAINTAPAVFSTLGLSTVHVNRTLQDRLGHGAGLGPAQRGRGVRPDIPAPAQRRRVNPLSGSARTCQDPSPFLKRTYGTEAAHR